MRQSAYHLSIPIKSHYINENYFHLKVHLFLVIIGAISLYVQRL